MKELEQALKLYTDANAALRGAEEVQAQALRTLETLAQDFCSAGICGAQYVTLHVGNQYPTFTLVSGRWRYAGLEPIIEVS